jgi:hypothetical protein
MRKLMFLIVVMLVISPLAAQKIYRRDGSFYEVKRNHGIFAQKIMPGALKSIDNYSLKWDFKGKHIVIRKDGSGNLPVYLYDANPIIADNQLFYGGQKDPAYIAKKYGLELIEILQSYGLYEFRTDSDSIKTAQAIVENGDGFAFPNIIRRMELRTNPVKFPIDDEFYKDGYQWKLKNTGKGINPQDKEINTLKNADIRFEKAIEFIYNSIENEELPDFAVSKVAIMDSGVDMDHPDLKNKLEPGWNMVHEREGGDPGEIETGGMMGTAGYAHGTNCAGVAAAEGNDIGVVGVCPWCEIYPVTYMEGGMGGAADEKQLLVVYEKYTADPSIGAINCSFGPMAGLGTIPVSSAEKESHTLFMRDGRNGLGGVIVYASGNDGIDASYHRLMGEKFKFERDEVEVENKVVVVGASSAWDTRVGYSNYGYDVDIIAPSLSGNPLLGITTTYLVGYGDHEKDYTLQFSGTSSAAPVVTGFFGVVFSVNPNLTLEEAVEIMKQSSDKINPETGFWDSKGHSVKFGYGRVNLYKAARLAAGLDMCEENSDETSNNMDDNCDGFVDEGLTKDISFVGSECSKNADCATEDFDEADVECITGEYKIFNFEKGYCTIRNKNFACPDGTQSYAGGQSDANCFLECNDDNKCPSGFSCDDKILGKCWPKCESDDDCSEGAYCNKDEGYCKRNPSEPGGECDSSEDCKYSAMCITQVPNGFCLKMCSNDSQCGDEGAKCVKVDFGGSGPMDICLPGCEKDSDCRSFGTMMSMKCHDVYSEKEDVCSMPCQTDKDCFDDGAVCKNTKCVDPDGSVEENDEDETTDTDVEEMIDEDTGFEDDPVVEDDDKKKKSGCSITVI